VDGARKAASKPRGRNHRRGSMVSALPGAQRLGFLERVFLETPCPARFFGRCSPAWAAFLVLLAGYARGFISVDTINRTAGRAKNLRRGALAFFSVMAVFRVCIFFSDPEQASFLCTPAAPCAGDPSGTRTGTRSRPGVVDSVVCYAADFSP